MATRLHHPGRPQWIVTGPSAAGDVDVRAERELGARLVRVRNLAGAGGAMSDVGALFDLAKVIDRATRQLGGPLVVHGHDDRAAVLAGLAAKAERAYSVRSYGDGDDVGVPSGGALWSGLRHAWASSSSSCDVALFESAAALDEARSRGDLKGARLEVVGPGVDVAALAARAGATKRPAADGADDDVVLLAVGLRDDLAARVTRRWRERFSAPSKPRSKKRARTLVAVDGKSPSGALAGAEVVLTTSHRRAVEAVAAGVRCVVLGSRALADELSWCKTVRVVPAREGAVAGAVDAAAIDAIVDAIVDVTGKVARTSKIPRELTLEGKLEALTRLYDDLLGPPRPSESERRFVRRRSRGRSR